MYVDESGDCGLVNSPTRYFVLTGIVIHELRWRTYLNQLVDFRRRMRTQHGLKLREEIHVSEMIGRAPGALQRIRKHERLAIYRKLLDELAGYQDLNIINVIVDKQGKGPDCDVFETAWRALIQRFENTIQHHNFPGPRNPDERGMILPDRTDDLKLTKLMRRMRYYNPVPGMQAMGYGGYRNLQMAYVIGDPKFRQSHMSYLIQAADAVAFALYQYLSPNSYVRKKSARKYFLRLDPVLCKVAAKFDPLGIVRL
ncbi:MAG: DUF3800 domain-containing protein [Candidatus Sulfotelmatobacter sp.]